MQRHTASICPISTNEILIVGGLGKDKKDLTDAVIFNTTTMQSKRVIQSCDIAVPHLAGDMKMIGEGQAIIWIVEWGEDVNGYKKAYLVRFIRQDDHCAFDLVETVDFEAVIEAQAA